MPEGNFTCADLVVVKNKMEQMWADSVVQKQYTPQANSALAVLTEQTAQFVELKDSMKDNTVRVEWIDHCAGGVTDCTDECTITGSEAEATQAVKNVFKKNKSRDAKIKELSETDIAELERLDIEELLKSKPKGMSDEDWIEANLIFGKEPKNALSKK